MHSKIILSMAMLAVVAGCGDMEQSSDAEAARQAEQADITLQSFTVRLDRATTEQDAIPRIVAAAHDLLAARCEEQPGGSVRVYNPFASEAYEDVSCASVLEGDDTTGEASAALVTNESDGPIGTAQQSLSPLTVGCGIFVGIAGLFATYVLCPRATTPRDEKRCGYVTNGGFFGLGVACAFM